MEAFLRSVLPHHRWVHMNLAFSPTCTVGIKDNNNLNVFCSCFSQMRNLENLSWTWILIHSSLMPIHLSGKPSHPWLRCPFMLFYASLYYVHIWIKKRKKERKDHATFVLTTNLFTGITLGSLDGEFASFWWCLICFTFSKGRKKIIIVFTFMSMFDLCVLM